MRECGVLETVNGREEKEEEEGQNVQPAAGGGIGGGAPSTSIRRPRCPPHRWSPWPSSPSGTRSGLSPCPSGTRSGLMPVLLLHWARDRCWGRGILLLLPLPLNVAGLLQFVKDVSQIEVATCAPVLSIVPEGQMQMLNVDCCCCWGPSAKELDITIQLGLGKL